MIKINLSKSFNLTVTAFFSLIGVACLGMAVHHAFVPMPEKQAEFVEIPVDMDGCIVALQKLGFSAKTQNTSIVAQAYSLDNAQEVLDKASLGIAACRIPLASFCAGEGCETPGVSFVLNKSGKDDTVAPKSPAAAGGAAAAAPGSPAGAPAGPAKLPPPVIPPAPGK